MTRQKETLIPSCTEGFNEGAQKIRFDPEAYAKHLAQFDLTEAQKLTLMRTVWDMMVMFADAGFGIDGPTLAKEEKENEVAAIDQGAGTEKPQVENTP